MVVSHPDAGVRGATDGAKPALRAALRGEYFSPP